MRQTQLTLAVAVSMALGSTACWAAADVNPPAGPQAPAAVESSGGPEDLLGAAFENQSAGISLRLPAGCERIASGGAGDDLGQFTDDKRKWVLKIARIQRNEPTHLTTVNDNFGKALPGSLHQTLA